MIDVILETIEIVTALALVIISIVHPFGWLPATLEITKQVNGGN